MKGKVDNDTNAEPDEWQLDYKSLSFRCNYDKDSNRVTVYCEALGACGSSGMFVSDRKQVAINLAKEITTNYNSEDDA